MTHRWDPTATSGLVRCRRCRMIVTAYHAKRGGLGPCIAEKDPITVSGPIGDLRAGIHALDQPKAVPVASSQSVGTLYRCLDCPGLVTFDSEMKAWDHAETTGVDTGRPHRIEPMLQVRDEKGDDL